MYVVFSVTVLGMALRSTGYFNLDYCVRTHFPPLVVCGSPCELAFPSIFVTSARPARAGVCNCLSDKGYLERQQALRTGSNPNPL